MPSTPPSCYVRRTKRRRSGASPQTARPWSRTATAP